MQQRHSWKHRKKWSAYVCEACFSVKMLLEKRLITTRFCAINNDKEHRWHSDPCFSLHFRCNSSQRQCSVKQGLCTHLTRSTREHPDILDRIFVAKKVTIRILGQTVWSNLPLLLCLTHTHTNYPQTESMWAGSMQATWSKSTERQQIVRMFEKGI